MLRSRARFCSLRLRAEVYGLRPIRAGSFGFFGFFLFFLIILEHFSYFVFTDSLAFFSPDFFGIAVRFSNFQNLKLFNFKIV
jgi:hypothetical protein